MERLKGGQKSTATIMSGQSSHKRSSKFLDELDDKKGKRGKKHKKGQRRDSSYHDVTDSDFLNPLNIAPLESIDEETKEGFRTKGRLRETFNS